MRKVLVLGALLVLAQSTLGAGRAWSADYPAREIEMFPKPVQRPFPIYIGGHNEAAVARAARLGQGWLPGWRPFDEVRERTALLRRLTAEAGRDPREVEAAVQFTLVVGRTPEEAAARYRATGMVQHRKSLAHSGRDPSLAEANNLIGSPQSLGDKIAFLRDAGVDHLCALQFPHDTVTEMLEQMEWFARDVMPAFSQGAHHA